MVRHGTREQRRLVVAPRPQPPAMKRHRRDDIGVSDQICPCPRHPGGEGGRAVGPVRMLEADNKAATCVVIALHRAGALVQGTARKACATEAGGTDGADLERIAAGRAHRGRDEAHLLPTGAAQRPLAARERTAGEALGRQHQIKQPAEAAPRATRDRRTEIRQHRHGVIGTPAS